MNRFYGLHSKFSCMEMYNDNEGILFYSVLI
uniref:Uncharacterized protein n=1 Tax=Anguilla anguilla TaxID=7936 RepID=A0A0E9UAZ2_ANGAN